MVRRERKDETPSAQRHPLGGVLVHATKPPPHIQESMNPGIQETNPYSQHWIRSWIGECERRGWEFAVWRCRRTSDGIRRLRPRAPLFVLFPMFADVVFRLG